MKKLLLLGLSTFAISAHAWEPSYYVGAGVSPWKVNSQTTYLDYSIQTIDGVAGIVLFPHIALEVRAGAGINEGRDTVYFLDQETDPVTNEVVDVIRGETATTELKYFASAYFRPFISNDKASLYGLLGVTTVQIESNVYAIDLPRDDTENAVSYGVGVSFAVNKNFDVTAEWKKLINADDFDIRGGTIGFAYKF
ncbi:MAG: porin family protein [Cellvibrionaceae bacterium]|nr:porin family protein [Cellvibrionaceae bacterium]